MSKSKKTTEWNPKSDLNYIAFRKSHNHLTKLQLIEMLYSQALLKIEPTQAEKDEYLSNLYHEMNVAVEILREFPKKLRGEMARQGAFAKAAKSPKSKSKKSIARLWLDWQDGKSHHASAAAFCRHVLNIHHDIESNKTIERWIREWSKNGVEPELE